MFKVTFKFENGEDVTTFAQEGEILLEVARKTNVAIDAPCSGNASCGKCKVKLVAGEMNSPKTRHISNDEYAEGWRLACVSKLTGDVEVQVPDIASAYRSRMKVADLSSREEIAIFEQAKSDVEAAGITLKNSLDIIHVTMDEPTLMTLCRIMNVLYGPSRGIPVYREYVCLTLPCGKFPLFSVRIILMFSVLCAEQQMIFLCMMFTAGMKK